MFVVSIHLTTKKLIQNFRIGWTDLVKEEGYNEEEYGSINDWYLVIFSLVSAAIGSKRKPESFKDEDYYISSIPKNQVGHHW